MRLETRGRIDDPFSPEYRRAVHRLDDMMQCSSLGLRLFGWIGWTGDQTKRPALESDPQYCLEAGITQETKLPWLMWCWDLVKGLSPFHTCCLILQSSRKFCEWGHVNGNWDRHSGKSALAICLNYWDKPFCTSIVIFTIHTSNYVLEDYRLAPFHTWHSNAGIDWPRSSPADARNATLMPAAIQLADGEALPYFGLNWK